MLHNYLAQLVNIRLTGETLRVLIYLMSIADKNLKIEIRPFQIAEKFGMNLQNTNRVLQNLKNCNLIIREEGIIILNKNFSSPERKKIIISKTGKKYLEETLFN